MGWSSTRSGEARYPHGVDEVLDAANARFTRLRYAREALGGDEPLCVTASRESVAYIESFWTHVAAAIAADPRRLGVSVQVPREGQVYVIEVAGIRAAMRAADGVDTPAARIKAGALAPLVVMSQVLNTATGEWAGDLQQGRCPLAFEFDAERYVSLRALLPRRTEQRGAVGGNAPTLVMGGTATALTMCWNLLYQLPRAYRELTGDEPDRATMETLWTHTRELIFRIGGGSLAAFVALASACSSNSSAMAWDGAGDLGLARRGERFAWVMNDALRERYAALLESVQEAQHGHYVGCAALYARAAPLPLDPNVAEPIDDGRQAIVFNEIVRWISAVARAEYFPLFPA